MQIQTLACLIYYLSTIILLIREAKSLDPFLRKLRGRRSVKFGTVIDYIEKECRMLIFFKIMPKITIINHNLKCCAGQPHTRCSSTTQATVHRRRCKNTAGLGSLSIYKYVKQNFGPLFTKNTLTEEFEIWLIFFKIMPTKYIKLIKRHYTHYHAFDIYTHIQSLAILLDSPQIFRICIVLCDFCHTYLFFEGIIFHLYLFSS